MLAILSAPGSRGDVNPMIAIGRQLKHRGHDVVISLAETYAELATDAGLISEPVIDRNRFDELLSSPNVWKPIRGARMIVGKVASEFLPLHLDVIRRHHVPGKTVLVSHPLDFASRIFRDAEPATPLVDVQLAPSMLRTYSEPPRMTPWWWECSRPQWLVRLAYQCVDALAVDPAIAPSVNRARRDLGLTPVRRIIDKWWLSPDMILAMYPKWFAPATEQFAPRLVHCGFPLSDIDSSTPALPDDRPIVFTAGTAHHHSLAFFKRAAATCQALNQPGLLLSSHRQNFPERLPPMVRTAGYVPLSNLLPHCSVCVHHGGVGTTSACFAAATPQLVRPMAFDQFDNATRVERLGAGKWLRRERDMTETIRCILADRAMAQTAVQIASKIRNSENAVEFAAEKIEACAR